MKLSQIITEISTIAPNELGPELLISWVNQSQINLFRYYPLPDAAYAFTLEAGEQFADLPENCPMDRARTLVVGDREIPYLAQESGIEVGASATYWSIVLGQMFVSPMSLIPQECTLFYRPRPRQLTIEDLDQEPEFPSDLHELLILNVAVKVAGINPSLSGLYVTLQGQFQQMKEQCDLMFTRRKQKSVYLVRDFI